MKKVAMHLRKSRADLEAEARGEGETLAKHRKALLKVAAEQKLNIIEEFQEIVSGEMLVHRPEMLDLLKKVESNTFDAVLCMDIDRFGRGDMEEQGLILKTFKRSKTLIITPRKTYNLDDEWDEEYSEFEAFMARKELKIINRRMQRGRIDKVESGNYLGTQAPYGYQIKKLAEKGRTLEPHHEQSKVVKMIFDWYTHDIPNKRLGASNIANRLNNLGYTSKTGIQWTNSAVLNIIKNAVYAGRIQWKKKDIKKSLTPGKKKDVKTRDRDEWIDVKGKHEAIVSEELFDKAQRILKSRYHVPYQLVNGITNPLAGVIVCGKCGAKMVYRPYTKQKPHLKCYNNPRCNNKASNFELVEHRLIEALTQWLESYKLNLEDSNHEPKDNNSELDFKKAGLKNLEKELAQTKEQINNLHDLLEQKLYTPDVFIERSNILNKKLDKLQKSIQSTKSELKKLENSLNVDEALIPQIEKVLEVYSLSTDPKKKNDLIKSVLEKAVYTKEKNQFRDNFQLVIHPRVE